MAIDLLLILAREMDLINIARASVTMLTRANAPV